LLRDLDQVIGIPIQSFRIAFVYITEAHATDVWNIGMSAGVLNESHKNLADRIKCATALKDSYSATYPIYVDNMNNDFETVFASWPARLFILRAKRVELIGSPSDSEIDFNSLFNYFHRD
jgi:hypothetical protein